MLAKPPGAMTLVREAGRQRDLRKRQVGLGKKILRSPHTALNEILVRSHALRLLECTRKMIHRQPGNTGQRSDADVLFQMRIDELAHALQRAGRQASPNARTQCDDCANSKIARGREMSGQWLPGRGSG